MEGKKRGRKSVYEEPVRRILRRCNTGECYQIIKMCIEENLTVEELKVIRKKQNKERNAIQRNARTKVNGKWQKRIYTPEERQRVRNLMSINKRINELIAIVKDRPSSQIIKNPEMIHITDNELGQIIDGLTAKLEVVWATDRRKALQKELKQYLKEFQVRKNLQKGDKVIYKGEEAVIQYAIEGNTDVDEDGE
jgi:hypothetical protein